MARGNRRKRLAKRVGGKSHSQRLNFRLAHRKALLDKNEHEAAEREHRECQCRVCMHERRLNDEWRK